MTNPSHLFDHRLRDIRRRRALHQARGGEDFLLALAVDDLIERLGTVQRNFAVAAEIGSPTSRLADALAATGRADRVMRLDRIGETAPDILATGNALPFGPGSLDLIVSALELHWVDDLPGLFAQIRQTLKPDGLFLATMLGGDTLAELRESLAVAETEVTGGAGLRVAPFGELPTIGALLQRAGFALPVIDRDRRIVRYKSARSLMRDLRAMGATNVLTQRSRTPISRRVLARCEEIYAERFSDPDGRLRATFDLISLSGWAPHTNQQQPLRPGSATARLADALSTTERSAGEKTGK